jgi:phosphoribosylformylglycinamidine cyclo-ligase
VLPVFDHLLGFADVARDEAYRTFNMGIGFVVILPESEAKKAEAALSEAGETVYRIGRIHKLDGEAVTLVG